MQQLKCGDVVVHPQHGPAAVKGFTDRMVRDDEVRYVDMETIGDRKMRIKVPVNQLVSLGVRAPLTPLELDEVFAILGAPSPETEARWTDRIKFAEQRLQTGTLTDAACVARDFVRRHVDSKVSAAERELMERAMRVLYLEVAVVRDVPRDQGRELVEAAILHRAAVDMATVAQAA